MVGGGEYSWIRTDTGYVWSGPGAPPGCGPGCCGGCRINISQRSFQVPGKENIASLLSEGQELGDEIRNKFNPSRYPYTPDTLSNYVTKKELEEALKESRGVCGMSIDKENSGRCTKRKGHSGFCDNMRY